MNEHPDKRWLILESAGIIMTLALVIFGLVGPSSAVEPRSEEAAAGAPAAPTASPAEVEEADKPATGKPEPAPEQEGHAKNPDPPLVSVPHEQNGKAKAPEETAPTAESASAGVPAEPKPQEAAPVAVETQDHGKGDNAANLLKQASELEKNGKLPSALGKYASALKKASTAGDQKTMAGALRGAARTSLALGKHKEALTYIGNAIAINQSLKNAKARSLDLILAGRIHVAQSDFGPALESFQEAAKILPVSEAAEMPALMEDTAACLLRLHRLPEALAALNRSLGLYGKQGSEADSARLNVMMGDIQVSRSDYAAARGHFVKAEKSYRELKRTKELGETLFRLAYLDQTIGDVKAAQKALEEGQAMMGNKGDAAVDALPLLVRGMKAYQQGNIIQAVNDLSTALNRYESAGDSVMAARVRLNLANIQMERARFKPALEMGGRALEEFRSRTILGGEAGALLLVGEVYFRQGFVQKAQEYVQEAATITKKIGDRDQAVLAKIVLAEIQDSLGNADAVPKLLAEAVEDAKSGVNRRTRGLLRLALARFRLSRDDTEKALTVLAEARKDFQEINDRRGIADCEHLTGLAHELSGEREKARQILTQALNEHRAMWDRYGEGRDLTALGVNSKNLGDPDKALEYFDKALEIRQGIGDRRGAAANLANIGNVLRHRAQISEAQSKLEQALATYRELSDRRGEADTLTNLGHVDAARGTQSAALEKFSLALKMHREIHDNRGAATDLSSMGKLYLAKGDLDNAYSCLEEAAKINKRIRNPKGEVSVLAELAMLQRARGNSTAALALLNKALELARQSKDERGVSSINIKMAGILEDAGEYAKALAILRQTLSVMREKGDKKGELWALSGIGVVQAKTEDYENALKNLHEASRLRTELGLQPSQTRDLDFYLGEIYEGFKDYDRALDYYHRALSVAQNPGNEVTLGKIYDRTGNLYYRMEEYPKAKEFLEDALRLSSDARNTTMQKNQLIRMGDIASKLGDSEGALKYQQRALTLTRETKDEHTESRILTRIGTLHQMLGKPRLALENYRDALGIRSKLGDRRGINENLLQIALVSSGLGDHDEAVADLKKAFGIAQSSEDRSMLWKAYFIMGRTLEGKQSPGEALEAYRKAIEILEAIETDVVEDSEEDDFIFGGKTALFETTLRVLMRLAKKDPGGAYDNQALKIVERLKAADFENTLSRINVDSFSDLPPELLIKEKSLKLTLRRLNARLEQERSRVNPDQAAIKKLLEERRARENVFKQLREHLVKEYPAYADLRYPRPTSLHQLQKKVLDPDEAVLEFMVTRGRTYLFAIDKNRFHTYATDYSGQEMERDVEILTRPLHRADTQASWDPSVAYRLYARLVKPLEYFLVGKKTVVIIPHGPLNSVPFEILVDSKSHAGKRFWSGTDRPSHLVEKYAFCYAPSASVLSQVRARKRDKTPGWNLVAFGEPIFSDEQKTRELNPGAEKLMTNIFQAGGNSRSDEMRPPAVGRREMSEIARVIGGPHQIYLGGQATETLFKKADLSRYAYVHLATHGVILGSRAKYQQQPAIVFSLYGDKENDGFLQLGEAFGLKLNSDMVVLSSSLVPGKNSSGEANGMMGLARALLFAGTDSVILSVWQVNDDNTSRLFVEMYRNLKEGSKSEALREAKLALLKNPGTSHPYYWGSFLLMGDWHVRFHPSMNRANPETVKFKGVSTWKKLLKM